MLDRGHLLCRLHNANSFDDYRKGPIEQLFTAASERALSTMDGLSLCFLNNKSVDII